MAKDIKKEEVKKVDSKVEALKDFEAKHLDLKKLYPVEYELGRAEFEKTL